MYTVKFKKKRPVNNLFSEYHKSDVYSNASNTCMSLGDLYLERDYWDINRNSFICAILWNPGNAYSHWKVGLINV